MAKIEAENAGPIEIYYEEWGAGEPVVLIGGLTSTVEVWGGQVPALAERYRVVTPDNRGSGRTRVREDDGLRTAERFAGDVLALLDGLGLERVHLLGASMGGTIVQEFALQHPERLATLTIACSSFGGSHAVRATPEVVSAMVEGAAEEASEEARRAAAAVLVHPDTPRLRPEALARYLATKEAHPHSAAEIARRAAGIASFDVYDRLPELRLPVLVLAGDSDVLVPSANAALLAERIPGAELVWIRDAGHIFFAEQPEATNRALLDFLDRHAIV
jgi:3-oxoadipate enol-lactonase